MNPNRLPRRFPQRLLALLTVGLLLFASCSDSEDDDAVDDSATTTQAERASISSSNTAGSSSTGDSGSETTMSDASTSTAEICDVWVSVDTKMSDIGDPDADPAVVKDDATAIDAELGGVGALPPDLTEPVQTVRDGLAPLMEGQLDTGSTDTPEYNVAYVEIGAWVFDNCGFQDVDAEYANYKYVDIPSELSAGNTVFRFQNTGTDLHMVVLEKLAADDDRTADEIANGALEQMDGTGDNGGAQVVTAGGFALPGEDGYLSVDLEPGRYVMLCPLPMGWTGDGPPPEDAAPHFTAGMFTELTVK